MEREGVSLIKHKSDQWSGKRSYHWGCRRSLCNIFILMQKKKKCCLVLEKSAPKYVKHLTVTDVKRQMWPSRAEKVLTCLGPLLYPMCYQAMKCLKWLVGFQTISELLCLTKILSPLFL